MHRHIQIRFAMAAGLLIGAVYLAFVAYAMGGH